MLFWRKVRWWEYALELALLVLGVSLSLWFESIRQEGDERQHARTYLVDIRAEIQKDTADLLTMIELRRSRIAAAEAALRALDTGPSDSLLHRLALAARGLNYRVSEPTLEAFISRGQLNRLPELGLADDSLSAGLRVLAQQIGASTQAEARHDRFVADHLQPLVLALGHWPVDLEAGPWPLLSPAQLAELRSHRALQNHLRRAADEQRMLIWQYEALLGQMTHVLQLLERRVGGSR